eukprot:TRINITY_DN272_c0_g1_i1.p1 TRINITY_DN272_c0_g1~~TRINITY_DN272_c0_g1_i1.p1  ORF type:complete len:285 (-),score=57.19 TRINITY_DN272_c0_g1_i1:59-913(-)
MKRLEILRNHLLPIHQPNISFSKINGNYEGYETLSIDRTNKKIAIITFNRINVLNAINNELGNELKNVLKLIDNDTDIYVVILTGQGKAFSVGADLKMMEKNKTQGGTGPLLIELATLRSDKPMIAMVNGYAYGGGMEIALACDIIVASEKAKFALPEIKLGIIPGAGGTIRLPYTVGKSNAMKMILTGEPIEAKEAQKMGFVSDVFPHESLLNETLKIANSIALKSQVSTRIAKESVNSSFELGLNNALKTENNLFNLVFKSDDTREGLKAFNEKRLPVWKNK